MPLKQLADISVEDGPVQISREDGQRRMGIEFNVKGRDIGSFVREAQEQIAEEGHAAQRLLPELGRPIRKPAAGDETAGDHPADGGRD